jgi:hypothetical protein
LKGFPTARTAAVSARNFAACFGSRMRHFLFHPCRAAALADAGHDPATLAKNQPKHGENQIVCLKISTPSGTIGVLAR